MCTWKASGAALFAAAFAVAALLADRSAEAQPQSRLYEVTKSKKLRVCQYPALLLDLVPQSEERADRRHRRRPRQGVGQGARCASSRSSSPSFATFIADLQANKCEIGMFGVGATLKRAQAVEFSKPYLVTNIYAVTRKDGKIKTWEDIDKKGVKAAVSLGSYIEIFMKGYLKNAEIVSVAPPNTREAELVAQRVDVIMTDFPTAIKVTDEFDWATYLLPNEKLAVTPYAYVVPPGDQIWLNYINLFVDTIKLDGRLMQYAKKHKLDPIVAP